METAETAGSQAVDHRQKRVRLKIELVNGSTIELKGVENAMALRGRSLAGVVLDEAAFMDSAVWFEVLRPALADKQGWALFISTPDGTASWFFDLWNFAVEEEASDWTRWSFTTIEGGTSHRKKSRLRAPNSTQEPSVKSLKPALRTYPA